MCSEIEDVKHLIFECKHVKMIWSTLSLVIEFDIQWRHVILGFYFKRNAKNTNFTTIVSYTAYKYLNIKCVVNLKTETYNGLVLHLKNNIRYNIDVLVNISKIHMFRINGYWYFAERNGTERNQLRGPKRGNKIFFKRHYFNLTYRKWKIVLQILLF